MPSVDTNAVVTAQINGSSLEISARGSGDPSIGRWVTLIEYSDLPSGWEPAGTFISVYTGLNQMFAFEVDQQALNLLTACGGSYEFERDVEFAADGRVIGEAHSHMKLVGDAESITGSGDVEASGDWTGVSSPVAMRPFAELWQTDGAATVTGVMSVPLVAADGSVVVARMRTLYRLGESGNTGESGVRALTATFTRVQDRIYFADYQATIAASPHIDGVAQ